MARHQTIDLNVRAANENGDATDIGDYQGDKIVSLHGTFTATLQLEGSLDGTVWTAIGASSGTPVNREFVTPWRYIRVVTSGYGSGAPKATFGGHNSRTV